MGAGENRLSQDAGKRRCPGHATVVERGQANDQQPDEQACAGRGGRWAERGEHAGSDHRAQPGDHGVTVPNRRAKETFEDSIKRI